MATVALEINDRGIAAVGETGLLFSEPAYAMLDAGRVVVGDDARAQARLKPRHVNHFFWAELGLAPVLGEYSAADLAYRQLSDLWSRLDTGSDAIFVVPGHYGREQLGLILGMAEECGIPVRALVDAAVAASTRLYPGYELMHLDLGQSHATLTSLEQGNAIARLFSERVAETGTDVLLRRWNTHVAQTFLARTRFDPMHSAVTEQQLFDRLPGWLASLHDQEELEVSLEQGETRYAVTLQRTSLVASAEPLLRGLMQQIGARRSGDGPLLLELSEEAGLPGVRELLAQMDDTAVMVLEPGAAGVGALMRSGQLSSGPRSLVRTLPTVLPPGEPPVSTAPAVAADDVNDAEAVSHVVYQGRARALDGTSVSVGREPEGERILKLSGEHSGISAIHFRIDRRADGYWLVDLSRYGTFVNGRRVHGEARLRPGDRIRAGSPGEELLVIGLE